MIEEIKKHNDKFIEILRKKIGANYYPFYFTELHYEDGAMAIKDGNIVIPSGKDNFINIFSFEIQYFNSYNFSNSIHFHQSDVPCDFNKVPLSEIMKGKNMPTIYFSTRLYGVLENVNLYYYEESDTDEKAIITRAIAFSFTNKVVCFESHYNHTNETDIHALSKEDFKKFIKENKYFEL